MSQHTLTVYVFHGTPLFGRKLLLLRRALDAYKYPGIEEVVGGTVERGEDPRTAALRELYEETGLKGAIKHFKDYPYSGNINHVYYMIFFIRRPKINIGRNPDREHIAYTWKPIRKVGQLAFRHSKILQELLQALNWI